jgi:hypothetical protein
MKEKDFLYMNKTTLGHILDWCVNEYGHSKHVKHGLLKYRMNPRTFAKGWFYPAEVLIEVNPKAHTSLVDFVHTAIHEYTHYLQDQVQYEKYARTLDDSKNPMEIEADLVAMNDKKRCLRHIKKLIDYER